MDMLLKDLSGFFTSNSGIMACIGALSLILACLRIGTRRSLKTSRKTSEDQVPATSADDDEDQEPESYDQVTHPPSQPRMVQVQVNENTQLHDLSPSFLVLTAEPHQPSLMTPPSRPAQRQNSSTETEFDTRTSWEVAFDRNLRHSNILRLPDELLLKILGATNTAGLFMLRQTSFTFWRLYHDKTFSRYHRSTDYFRPKRAVKRFENSPETVRQAKKSALCGSCLRTRDSADYDRRIIFMQRQLHCSRCKANHRYIHFSQDQRREVDNRARECVGAQGRLRLCAHKTVNPAALLRWVRQNGGTSLSPHDRFVVDKCQRCADIAFHSGLGGRSPEVSPPAISVLRSTWPEYRGSADGTGITYLVEWTLPVLEIPRNERVSDQDVRRALEGLGEMYGDILCPHFTFRNGQLLRPFDPRHCVCFGHDTRVGGGGTNYDSDSESGIHAFSCRKRRCQLPGDPSKRTFISHPYGSSMRRHDVECGCCKTTYSWKRKGGHVFLQRVSYAAVDSPRKKSTASFHKFLEPRSYGATSDEETKHLLWCDDAVCENGRNWEVYSKQF
ncbi:hypothetical protein CkaCkLH20_11177 [Colletotrichum karsti]|uniref:F-box domain-containing protein n=1 Tax=Colletotrichum karsti TaxID=1095194 RepID=A0A9P6HY69_9PEZI|nr:uncharacterized protein CkaCkLH20_11177 [Colletotrichum karsti]KAF9871256.1 hypothetical protein CkaCkLH20_11177 [Colletotrichum karsti]